MSNRSMVELSICFDNIPESGISFPLKAHSDSISHSSGTFVGCVVGDSEYVKCTPALPPPCLRGVILNAKRNEFAGNDAVYHLNYQ